MPRIRSMDMGDVPSDYFGLDARKWLTGFWPCANINHRKRQTQGTKQMARNLNSSVEVCFNEIVDAINAGQSWFVASYFNVSHTRAAYSAAFRMASEKGLITKNGSMWMVA